MLSHSGLHLGRLGTTHSILTLGPSLPENLAKWLWTSAAVELRGRDQKLQNAETNLQKENLAQVPSISSFLRGLPTGKGRSRKLSPTL